LSASDQPQNNQPGAADAPSAGDGAVAAGSSPGTSAMDCGSGRWICHKEWLLPCFTRPWTSTEQSAPVALACSAAASSAAPSGSPLPAGAQPQGNASTAGTKDVVLDSSSDGNMTVLHVSVVTCAVAPELTLSSPMLPRPPGKNYWVLDFGALPVGERSTRQVELVNSGEGGPSTAERPQIGSSVFPGPAQGCPPP
jgi:hypothetical protein